MAGYPAMDAGERTIALLSGRARSRGYPAMQQGRTAGELTGGNWHRRPQSWGVDSKQQPRTSARTVEREERPDMVKPPERSSGFALGGDGVVSQTASTPLTATGIAPSGYMAAVPGFNAPAPAPPADPPPEYWGDPYGMGMPPELPPELPPPSSPAPTPAPPAATSTNTGSVVLTVGALLAALLFS